ncbi:MAG: metallophosphoesterase [Planctomycetota bacterium]|nr:metallophosphoesterase [Planctomycetota bacterium]
MDVHGANSVWRKWLRIPELHGVDALLLCGDLTGKSLVPVIDKGNGKYNIYYFGKNWEVEQGSEADELEKRVQDAGAYTLRCDMDEVQQLQEDPSEVQRIMLQMILDRMNEWMRMILDKLDPSKVDVVVMPGNDDDFKVDDVIRSYEDKGIVWALDNVIEVLGIPMVSMDYVNPTPWDTEREAKDGKLFKMIKKQVKKLDDPSQAIFNFHAPPFDTALDLAPELDANKKPVTVAGQVNYVHVGSEAVRKAIEQYKPLMGLHGHIHESYGHDSIGETTVVNPGSEYSEGILRGYIIEVEDGKVKNNWKVEG